MNKVKKGSNAEEEYKNILKEVEGYEYVWKTMRSKWNDLDFYGLFDLVGFKGERRCYVQVKSMKKNPTENDFKKIEDKLGKHNISIKNFVDYKINDYENVEIAIRVNARWTGRGNNKHFNKPHWEIKKYFPSGKTFSYTRGCL